MATTLYCRESTNSGIGSFRDLSTSRGGGSTTGVVNSTAGGTNIQWTKTAGGSVLEWISGKVASAFTLSGTVSVRLRALESSMNNNCGGRCRIYRRTTGGSESEIGLGDDGAEFGTSEGNLDWTISPTSTDFAEDERIIVRFFITNAGGTMAAGTCTMSYDGPTASAAGDTFVTLNENVAFKPDHFSQTSFRWYEDGTEAGATAIAAQDTNISRNPSASPAATFKLATLRVRIQSTAVGGASNDDWPLYKSRNGGAYVRMGASVTGWWIFGNGSLTDNGATTNRLGSGSGSFVAGKICAGNRDPANAVDDYQLTAGNYTELVYELESTQDQRVNGDTWDFRVYYDAASSGSSYAPLGSYTQTPRLTVQHPQYDQRAFRFFNDDGSQTTSTAIAAQNTNPSYATLGSNIFHLRMQWQETAGFECVNNWQWAPYYRVNGGSWAQITDVSNYIRIVASANISDGETLTTSRLTGGTGSMVESYARDNGASNFSTAAITANNYKEMLHSMQLQVADWVDGDTLEICQAWGNATPGDSPNAVTQTVMPTISRAGIQQASASFAGAGSMNATARLLARASMSLAGAGSLSATARLLERCSASFAGAGSLSVSAAVQKVASATFSGAGSLVVDAVVQAGTVIHQGSALFEGAGSLSVAAAVQKMASATFSGTGSMSIDSVVLRFASSSFAGAGSMTVAAVQLMAANVTFGGAGSLTVSARAMMVASATFAGNGVVSVAAAVQKMATAEFDGEGILSVSARAMMRASATFAGSGNLTVAAVGLFRAAATFAGNGVMTVDADVIGTQTASATFVGAGNMTVAATQIMMASSSFAGSGSLTVAARLILPATATFAGSGGMTVAAIQRMAASASFAGSGNLTVSAERQVITSATFAGAGNLTVAAVQLLRASSSFVGAGSMTVAAVGLFSASASFAGAGSMTVDATVFGTQTANATFAGAGSMTTAARLIARATAQFDGSGVMTTLARLLARASATFAGAGSLTVDAALRARASATFAGSGNMTIDAFTRRFASSSFVGAGSMTSAAILMARATASFAGNGVLTVAAVQRMAISATFAGAGSLNVSADIVGQQSASATFQGAGSLTANVRQIHAALATFAGSGVMSVLTSQVMQVSALFGGTGSLTVDATVLAAAGIHFGEATFGGTGSMTIAPDGIIVRQTVIVTGWESQVGVWRKTGRGARTGKRYRIYYNG